MTTTLPLQPASGRVTVLPQPTVARLADVRCNVCRRTGEVYVVTAPHGPGAICCLRHDAADIAQLLAALYVRAEAAA